MAQKWPKIAKMAHKLPKIAQKLAPAEKTFIFNWKEGRIIGYNWNVIDDSLEIGGTRPVIE